MVSKSTKHMETGWANPHASSNVIPKVKGWSITRKKIPSVSPESLVQQSAKVSSLENCYLILPFKPTRRVITLKKTVIQVAFSFLRRCVTAHIIVAYEQFAVDKFE